MNDKRLDLDVDPFGIESTIAGLYSCIDQFSKENVNNNIKAVIKRIVYLDFIFKRSSMYDNSRYYTGIINDSLFALESINLRQKRYLYFNVRSLIENSFKAFLDKAEDEGGRLTDLKDQFKSFIGGIDSSKEFSMEHHIFFDCYKKSCQYVHNNIDIDENIVSSFEEIQLAMSSETSIEPGIGDFLRVLDEIIFFLSLKNSKECYNAFYRMNNFKRNLLSKRLYEKVKENIDNASSDF